jgi:hexosaminidase
MLAGVLALGVFASSPVFPMPSGMQFLGGSVTIPESARVVIQGVQEPAPLRRLLTSFLPLRGGKGRMEVRLTIDPSIPGGDEAYRLRIEDRGIFASAPSTRGLMWSLQTLRQLAGSSPHPPAPSPRNEPFEERGSRTFPKLVIEDAPKSAWRGVLVDEGRHFMGEATIKQFIDTMALYKYNVLHWHLTEDQGWRIEIKKYPNLTQVGAWRKEPDGTRYGGFYTQAQIKRIVKYAKDRGVTIVPEIEMPGHCSSALAAYPELGCRRAKIEVPTNWGVFTDVYCAGRESTFEFLEDVLDEVIPLFESPYLHIGGDEVPKTNWKACADCQRRMKAEGLADEHELQSWFIRRIQAYLKTKNRTLIGWDEILEGGLAKGAVVQVWQDIERAIPAVKAGSPVILSPQSHLYLNRSAESLSMRNVYEHTLLPAGITARDVLGHEVTLWSEHITPDNLFARFLPRGIAAAEMFWSDPPRDWPSFSKRIDQHLDWMDAQGIPYGPADAAISSVRLESLTREGMGRLHVETGLKDIEVRYTLNGWMPTRTSPVIEGSIEFPIGKTLTIRPFRDGKPFDWPKVFRSIAHLAYGRRVELNQPPAPRYTRAGEVGLTDGFIGSDDFDDGVWLGWQGTDVVMTVNLGRVLPMREVTLNCLHQMRSWIYLPKRLQFEVSSDGQSWELLGEASHTIGERDDRTLIHPFTVSKSTQARYVRATATSFGKLPDWHLGAGGDSWLFIDELTVR